MLRALRRRLFAPSTLRPHHTRLRLEHLEDRLVLSTFLVTNTSDNLQPGSLRYAISQANMPGNAGSTVEITPQATGLINLTGGELSITSDMTIVNDSGAPVEIHQATANARVFEIGANAANVTLAGGPGSVLTLDGGSVSGDNGGGILVDGAATTLTLSYVNVLNNSAAAAAGAGGNGGGIYAAGQVVLDHSVVGTTTAPNIAANEGGGVWAGTGLTLTASSIVGNQAGSDGGGVIVNDGNVTLDGGSAVNNNRAANGLGGGIDVADGSVFVRNGSHVDGNTALDEGGILVGTVAHLGDDAVEVTAGSTVNGNSSTATLSVSADDYGGGGIAVPTLGNVLISASQVSGNHTVGMYSGGIVVGLGSVTVTNNSQIDGNTNNGPGGGIAANFGGIVTVTGGSQVNGNIGASIGGGIVNFAGPLGGIVISDGSQVDANVLTNAETLQQTVAIFAQLATGKGALTRFATSVGGSGGAAMLTALQQTSAVAVPLAQQLEAVVQLLAPGPLVIGGGLGTLLAPITVEGGSMVSGNVSGKRVSGGPLVSVGSGGGLATVLGSITVVQGAVNSNQALQGDGGGIYNVSGSVGLQESFLDNNFALGNGGGIYNVSGSVYVLLSYIDGNIALRDGGGIFNASGSVDLVFAFLGGNFALGNGGGVWNGGLLGSVASILVHNESSSSGGGLFNTQGAFASLADSLFMNNTASQNGGALLNLGSLQAFDVTYVDNTPAT